MPFDALVSVIIPAYNAETHILDALESVLAQTYRHIEVIVVDDGSRDGTAAVVRAVMAEDERVRLVQQENHGVAVARNHGLELSNGAYVAPLDADDRWAPTKLEREVARLEAGGPTMGMVYSWWVATDREGRVTGATAPLCVEGDVHECLVWINFIGAASVPLFRRSALEVVGGYDPSLKARGGQGCEDWDLSLRVAERFRVGVVPEYLTEYRVVVGSMSFDCDSMGRSYDLVMEAQRARVPDLPARLLRWSRSNFEGYLASMSYAAGRYRDALRWYVRAALHDPTVLLGSRMIKQAAKAMIRLAAGEANRIGILGDQATARLLTSRPLPLTTLAAVRAAASAQSSPWTANRPYATIRRRRWEWLLQRSEMSQVVPPAAPNTAYGS